MNYQSINDVTESEVKILIEQGVIESTHLEYKRDIKFNNDKEKKELLADICSFCNIGGGTIIYGVDEKREEGKTTGIPESISGITLNADEIIRKIDESVRHSIDPLVIGLKMKVLRVEEKNLLVMQVPRSMHAPHMVTFKGSSKFWRRANASKYQMGVEEIRSTILGGNELSRRMKEFRSQRIGEILSGDTPVMLERNPLIVIHTLPVESFSGTSSFDLSALNQKDRLRYLPLTHHGCNSRLNFDGFFTYWAGSYDEGHLSLSYAQVYRSGLIETVDAFSLEERDGKKLIPSIAYESEIITTTKSHLQNLLEDGVKGPVLIFISLLGVRDYEMAVGRMVGSRFRKIAIDRDDLILPEVYVENIETYDAIKSLKPCFDMIWNACGYERSFNFDEQGNWVAK